ncbi:MAG: pirin [Nocardioidaceae bacterium]|nr:pirin [Nocardioidaceae bacterium]
MSIPVSDRLLPARDVPLGGVRGVTVERTLPHRDLPTIGAWCFVDHFGPNGMAMKVLPHPHTGLQTVTWPLVGQIRHRDSLGNDLLVKPGELNLMTAGHGIAHSELSDDPVQHGLQLWVALPAATRDGAPAFEHHGDLPTFEDGPLSGTVMVGELVGLRSPATIHSPLVGAELRMRPGSATLALDPAYEHGLLVFDGEVEVDGTMLEQGPLLYLAPGRESFDLRADATARMIVIGGEPFEEEIVMWWNFIGRSNDEIVKFRTDWEARGERFGHVEGHGGAFIPAPPLPNATLLPRRRRPFTKD